MAIIISAKARATAQDPNPEWHYFRFPDDANTALATAAIHKRLGVHRQYVYCEEREVPKGVTIVAISRAEVCPELALDTGRTQEATRRAFWRLGDRASKVPERPVGEADYSSLERRVLAHSMEQLAGHIAYEMSRITVMDMPTARALVDATVRVLTSKGPLTPDDLRYQPSPTPQADGQPAQVMGDTPPPCDQELFDQGVSVGLFDIPKWTAEALCRGIAAATEARVDWHYIGGRVHIKALPAACAPAQAQPAAQQGVAYAALPEPYCNAHDDADACYPDMFSEHQMRAFADATHALRASNGQASSQAGEYPALVCDYCGALTPDPWHSSGMLHGKMSKHIHSCDACAARGARDTREPLTPERVKEIVQGAGYDQCGIPDTERAAFINGLRHGEREHGIKRGPAC